MPVRGQGPSSTHPADDAWILPQVEAVACAGCKLRGGDGLRGSLSGPVLEACFICLRVKIEGSAVLGIIHANCLSIPCVIDPQADPVVADMVHVLVRREVVEAVRT